MIITTINNSLRNKAESIYHSDSCLISIFSLSLSRIISSVHSLSLVWLFAIQWTAACQASCPSPTPRIYPNSCPLSQWYHPTISSSVLFPSPPAYNLSQHHGLFKWVSSSIRWPKYWSFSFNISPSNEHSGLISFRMDYWISLQSKRLSESSPTPQFKSINSSALSFLYSPTLTSIHDYWKNHSLD